MFLLVIETVLLIAVAVAFGFLIGVLAKQMFGKVISIDGGPRFTEIMELADAVEAARQPRTASSDDDADLSSASSMDEVVAEVTAAADVVAPDLERVEAADRVGRRPPTLSEPLDGGPDDLRKIRGIGPQNEARLNALGIYHFSQIAAWEADEARWVGAYLAFPGRIEREDWIGQASALAGTAETPEA
jgi:NADH-quinone oxidoreductase subunit E